MQNILLVEPDYISHFPPLGLLKIGTYHKKKGDFVRFVRGKLRHDIYWDRVYITTLFSFHHRKTIDTILFYKEIVGGDLNRIFVGGIYASLYPNVINNETGIYPHVGLLDKPGILGNDEILIDTLIPDYSLIDSVDYNYGLRDSYFGYATRGCPNRCRFCSVHLLEPNFIHSTGLYEYVQKIRNEYGEKQNLTLMDNNILASNEFDGIISDIKNLGFETGAKRNGRKRAVDFNQGIDASRINNHTAKALASICMDPIRLAYDHVKNRKVFEKAVRQLSKEHLNSLSTYILYNWEDSPADLYARLRHCVELNDELGLQIYSFPMRYAPPDKVDRTHIGKKWTKREIRGLQCILNVTRGIVSHRKDFFLRAFGDSPEAFLEIVWMPDKYILSRSVYENSSVAWRRKFRQLTPSQKNEFTDIVGSNDRDQMMAAYCESKSKRIRNLLEPHIESKGKHPNASNSF